MISGYRIDVEHLAVKHRAKDALRSLMAAGTNATPALREGLRHADPSVRIGCCVVLDHFLDGAALPDLLNNLTHEDEDVRAWALHALACARCKEGECRPGEDQVVRITLRMLREDPSRRVRAQAAHLLGKSAAIRRPEVMDALAGARDGDEDPTVRKIARWYAPGGAIYQRTVAGLCTSHHAGARRPYPRRTRRAHLPLARRH